MWIKRTLIPFLVMIGLGTSVQGQGSFDYCPTEIDAVCLEVIVDHLISIESDPTRRQEMALQYAKVLLSKAPNHSARLAETYASSENTDWRSLRRTSRAFAAEGRAEDAAELIWAATKARGDDPNLRVKVLDMLLMGEDAADIGDLDLARRVHGAIIPHLPIDVNGRAPLRDELRLARLMMLYGWPEDAYAFLDEAYAALESMPRDGFGYGFALTSFLTVLTLNGHDTLQEQVEQDLLALLDGLEPEAKQPIEKAHVTALVEAGNVEEAQSWAVAYGLDFDATIEHTLPLFLKEESSYFPGIPQDTLQRYELILAAVKDPILKEKYLATLARHMVNEKQYVGLDTMLARVADPKVRSEIVLTLMTYHARQRDDARTSADLFFSEIPNLTPRFPSLGTFLQQYPVSLTARGLLEAGDLDRGGQLADVVLHLWVNDRSDRRRLDALIVGALAVVGEEDRLKMWYDASDDPTHKVEVLIVSLDALTQAGQFDRKDTILGVIETLMPLISDAAVAAPAYWPKDTPVPTLREDAGRELYQLNIRIVERLAERDRLSEAQDVLATNLAGDIAPWRAHVAIAQAMERVGDVAKANDIRHAVLDLVLDASLETFQLPYVIEAIHP